MRILIASDHAGFELRKTLFQFLKEKNFEITDLGPNELDHEDDYPDFVAPVAKEISENKTDKTITHAAKNKSLNLESEERFSLLSLSRQHNNSNILAIGARFVSEEEAKKAVLLWLETPFSGEVRHLRRIEKIDKLAP